MDVKKMIAQMTLEEKASLLSGADFWHTKAVERLGIPAIMVSDGPHDLRKQDEEHAGADDSIEAVCFPTGCAAAASFDRALLRTLGEALGDSCQHEKLAVVLGPAVNIKRSPLCGRNFEYYSEDPYLAGEMAAACISGVQSRQVGVSIKHFAANSQEHRRMSSTSDIDERTLREIYLAAFETAVKKAKPWTVMCSYNRLNGVFASENAWLLTEVLRREWGFDGVVMSDWGAVSDRVRGVAAGLDLEMPSSHGENDRKIVEAVRAGQLDEALVDLACERVLRLVEKYTENARPDTPWDKEAQHQLAARIAENCLVLLKNEGNALPLEKKDAVAFIGRFAQRPRFQGGGSSHIHCFKTTPALEAAQGLPVAYAPGYDETGENTSDALLEEAVEAARSAKAAVVFAGLPDSYESEGYDRPHMKMPEAQNRLIEAVAAVNPRTVVVLHNGSPVEMPWLDGVPAVLEAYLGGQAVGEAVVRALYGDVNPSGHLAESFPKKLSDNPSYLYYGGEGNRTEYREGVFVGYRYYDKKEMDVLFPFGHGLSYTDFSCDSLRLSGDSIREGEPLTASVTVTNTGARFGQAVPQLYVSAKNSAFLRPVRELKGFEKIALAPGESREVTFVLDSRAFALWHEQRHGWYVESGAYEISIGFSSRDLRAAAEVRVASASAPMPVTCTQDTIVLDLMDQPRAMEILRPALGLDQPAEATSAAAEEAITAEMKLAMMGYSPLRNQLCFGHMTYAELDGLIERINQALAKKE